MSAAIDALKHELTDKENELKRVEAETKDAIREGDLAARTLDSARRARNEVAQAIQLLEHHQSGERAQA